MYVAMKNSLQSFLFISVVLTFSAVASAKQIPLQAWVHDPVISSVNVNPLGDRLVGLTLTDVNKPPKVTVWDLNNMQAAPARFSPKDSKPLFVDWLNNQKLIVVGRQKFDVRAGGRFVKTFRDKIYIADSTGKKPPREILRNRDILGASIADRLPQDKNKVLINVVTPEFADDYYELDLRNYSAKRVYRGSPKNVAILDSFGKVAAKQSLERDKEGSYIATSYKHPQTGEWDEHHRFYAKKRRSLQAVGFSKNGRKVYVTDNRDKDKAVIRTYDIAERTLSEPLFGGSDFEATGVIISRHPDTLGDLLGFRGVGAKNTIKLVDQKAATMQATIDSALPKNRTNFILSMSNDYSKVVVLSTGVKEPSAYYLLQNEKELLPLGRSYPEIDSSLLSDMEYVEYKARDGFTVPAYLTKPKFGKAPYPTVIMPHGGPWARDFYGWDLWVQYLANRGYAVLQPQYRGSDGWGHALWVAGDNKWGELMQDDKDDGAAWLVKEGVADKGRIAMFGYSYGGYAAMAATVRPNSPYQCAIAGAGLSELRTFDKLTFGNAFQREFQNATIDGLSPLDKVKEANIPIYIFHGDRDQRVPIDQSRKFYKALQKANKTVEYNEIPDLWHSFPWLPTHNVNVLKNVEEYLATRCGDGGL